MSIKRIFFFLISLLFILPYNGYSQSAYSEDENRIELKDSIITPLFDTSTTIFQKINRDSFFEVVLQTNFDSLLKNKKVSNKKYPGTIIFKNGKGEQLLMKVKITARGKSRRKVCSMPPLKIDFPKKALNKLGLFPGGDKLKLVTHCNDTENSDQVLMKEFWIYNLYNQITPKSFNVFSIKITYVNSNNPEEKMERYAFFIESNDELELRLKGEIKNIFGTKPDMVDQTSYQNTVMFQYMIGNLDWDIQVNRNVKLVLPDDGGKLIVVPYDFDFSGLVRAPHARLNPNFNQKNIEERFAMGKFANKITLDETVKTFKNLEKVGFRCYRSCAVLDKSVKKKMRKYLNSFFSILKDKQQLEEIFLE